MKIDLEKAKKIFDSFGKTFTLEEAKDDIYALLEEIFKPEEDVCESCISWIEHKREGTCSQNRRSNSKKNFIQIYTSHNSKCEMHQTKEEQEFELNNFMKDFNSKG